MAGAIGLQVMGYLQGDTPYPMTYVVMVCAATAIVLSANLLRVQSVHRIHAETP